MRTIFDTTPELESHNGRSVVIFKDNETQEVIKTNTPIVDLPDGYDVVTHPEDPSIFACFNPNMPDFLQLSGFAFAAGNSARSLNALGMGMEDPSANNRKADEDKPRVKDLGNGLVMIEQPYKAQEFTPYKLSDEGRIAFQIFEHPTTGEPHVTLASHYDERGDDEWLPIDGDSSYYSDFPDFLSSGAHVAYDCALNGQDARAKLLALGFEERDDLFAWYTPQEVEFGFIKGSGDFLDPEWSVFTLPIVPKGQKFEQMPYCDDMREGTMSDWPEELFDGNLMENTFEVKEGLSREEVLKGMIALGYTHNPDLDEDNT
jgi:hypothetical protein